MQQAHLANINLFVNDPHKAYLFYSNVFGFVAEPTMSQPPDFLVLDAGSCSLSFQPKQTLGLDQEPVGGLELGFDVTDVSESARAFQQAGGQIERRNQMDWGESVDGRDLDGNRITIYRRR